MAEERHALTVEDSLALWLEGRVAFNAWTAKHRSADLNFSGVDFSQYRHHPNVKGQEWPFALRDCGNCSLTFDGANFGDGDTSFGGLMMTGADISFRNAMFGEGNVNFSGGQFRLCDFTEAKFGDGDLNFSHRNFVQETVFDHTKFGDGDDDFRFAKFGETPLENIFDRNPYAASFAGAVFGQGRILFSNAKIFRGDLTFFKTAFGDGGVSFKTRPLNAEKYLLRTLASMTETSILIARP